MTTASYIMAQYLKLIGARILSYFLCHVTSKLAVGKSRPLVQYGPNFVSSRLKTELLQSWLCIL